MPLITIGLRETLTRNLTDNFRIGNELHGESGGLFCDLLKLVFAMQLPSQVKTDIVPALYAILPWRLILSLRIPS